MSDENVAWAVKVRTSAGDVWGWLGQTSGACWTSPFVTAWWAAAMCRTRDAAKELAGDWCGRDAQHEARLVRVRRKPAPPPNGVATKPDLVLDVAVARMVRDNALDEARRAVGRMAHMASASVGVPVHVFVERCVAELDRLKVRP